MPLLVNSSFSLALCLPLHCSSGSWVLSSVVSVGGVESNVKMSCEHPQIVTGKFFRTEEFIFLCWICMFPIPMFALLSVPSLWWVSDTPGTCSITLCSRLQGLCCLFLPVLLYASSLFCGHRQGIVHSILLVIHICVKILNSKRYATQLYEAK